MARYVTNRRGKRITLLNPSERSRKFAVELKHNIAITNDGVKKRTKSGKVKFLSPTQKAFRSGYLQARKDNNKAFIGRKKKRMAYKRKIR